MTVYGYGDAGHKYDPDRYGRCRMANGGYCDGTRSNSMHEVRHADCTPDRHTPRCVAETEMRALLRALWGDK
jgi:hypothetical protein